MTIIVRFLSLFPSLKPITLLIFHHSQVQLFLEFIYSIMSNFPESIVGYLRLTLTSRD